MDNGPSNLQIWMQYCTSVLDKEQARNVLTTLITTLQCLLQCPLQPLRESDLLSQQQRDHIKKWNSRAPTESLDLCIHTVFRLQFMIQPDAPAVCAWDGSFSYKNLDVLSSKVQSRLMTEYGIGAGWIVPLLFEKSKWTVVGILGILKAGAGFVLLDPAFPERRLQEICTDVNAKVMVCSVNQSNVPWFERTIVVGDCVLHWKDELQPAPSTSSQSVAYIVYTSGSTGRPKGVIIQHGSFCTNVIASSRAQNLDRSSRVLQFASYAFDVSIHESLTALMLGGCACIPSESLRINSLKEAITGLQVNWAELTPSVARTLQPKDIPTVRTLVLGGESMSSDDIDKWKDHLRLICAYGPSECTVVATVQSQVREPRNIGHSFAGTCWIVDKDNHHCLVPIGAIGELVIGGPIVGQGYLNRPEQTAVAFIRNTRWASVFGMKNTQVFYKTGDLVRYASDGTIVYVGRKDTQVKLNGQRIELGEVESHARRLFKDAHITAEIASLPGKRPFLVLFLAPKLQIFDEEKVQRLLLCEPADGFQEEVQHRIAQLRHALPGYMVPTVYIPLKAMPVLRTGKVSRKLLRMAVTHLSEIQLKTYRPSFPPVANQSMKGPIQEVLRQLFAFVLDLPVDSIGLHDGFFELGGDSISSIALVGKAKERGINITVGSVFTHQSITKLAENIHRISVCGCGDQLIPAFSLLGLSSEKDDAIKCAIEQCRIYRSQVEDIYPCTALQEAMMTCTINHPGSFQATFRFQLPWTTDIAHFKQAWRKVSDANPILRTRIIQADAQRLLQVVVKNEDQHWDLISKDGEFADPIMSLGTRLVRFHLSDKPKNSSRLSFILTMHHCVFDGWSYMRILEAVEAAFRGLDLPRREFTPFIKYLSALEMNQARGFWNTEFRDLRAVAFPAPAPFPGYIPRSVTTAKRRIKLPKWPRGSYTPSAIITFAFSMLASWHTGSNDVVFGVIVTGRSAPLAGVDQMTGPTIATLPFRTVLQPGASVNECLGEMQDHFTSLIPFEQVGMRRIRGFSAEAAAACEFQGLLVIQAPAKAKCSELFFKAPKRLEEEWRFNMHLLTFVCELSSDSVLTVKALVDENFVAPDTTQMFLQQFEYLLCKTIDLPDARVDTIIPLRIPQPLRQIPLRSFNGYTDPDQLRIPFPKSSYSSLRCFRESEIEESPYRGSIHQEMYRSIVAHVLGIEVKDIDINSDFFALGGDSTSAMQATMLCRKAGLSLDAADIYNLRKIGLIASRLKPVASSAVPSNDNVTELNTRFSLLPPTSHEGLRTIQTEMKAKLGITEMEHVEDAYPLTAVHRGLLHTQLLYVSDHQSYTIWDATIEGGGNLVDPFCLRGAWSSIVHRHPALRTILLGSTPDTMAHVVLKAPPLDIQILSCKDDDALPLLRNSYLQDDTTGSPYMFTICRTNSSRVLCKLEGSHAFLDATSVLIILRELAQAYNGKHSTINGPLYSSAVRYFRDARSVNLESMSNYWKKQLAGVNPCIVPSISPDSTHPPKKNIHTTTISLADTTALKQFCASNGFTIGNIFEVAWGLILQWQTGSDDICFGSLVSGRNVPIPEVHNMIGPFFNVLVCRICLDPQSSMLDTLRKNQIEMGNRLLNQHCPLIDCLRLSDHFGRRLFNTCLSIEQQLSYTQAKNGICFRELETLEPTEVFNRIFCCYKGLLGKITNVRAI